MALGSGPGCRLIRAPDRRKRHWKYAHGRTVAGGALEKRPLHRTLNHITADAAPACVAHVNGTRLQPCGKFFAQIVSIEAASAHQRTAECERHFGIIRHRAWRESQPAAPYDIAVNAKPGGDFTLGHELDRGPEGITTRKSEKCCERAVGQTCIAHRGTLRSEIAGGHTVFPANHEIFAFALQRMTTQQHIEERNLGHRDLNIEYGISKAFGDIAIGSE